MTVINMPLDYSDAEHIDLSREGDEGLFWKQIIPMNKEIVYAGRTLKFDQNYLRQVKDAFDKRVLDQTAFQLANDENMHDTPEDIAKGRNFDPQRFRGEVQKLALNNRGLFAQFKLTKDGVELVKKNPKLGVSASLKPNYVDSDGNVHPVVLRHVLGTLDPKIKGMSPWTKDEISLSVTDEENEEVIDLAAADTDTPPAPTEGTEGGNETGGNENQVTVDKEVFESMEAQLAEYKAGEELLDQILAEDDDQKVSLSNEDPRVTAALSEVAKFKWAAQREKYINAGVPANLLNLATPVMEAPDNFTINLSNGETVDPRDTIVKMLEESKGVIDLSESGHGMSAEDSDSKIDQVVDDFTRDLF